MNAGPLRICTIGAGGWATRMHLPALKVIAESENVRFPAVCDLDRPLAEHFARELGAENAVTNARLMLEEFEPDGVAILTQEDVSPELMTLAAKRGVPFIVEKPPAADTETHRSLIKTVGELPHMVAYNRRHCPYVVQVKKWLEGITPQSVIANFIRYRRREADFTATAVHAIDTVRHLAGGNVSIMHFEVVPLGEMFNYFLVGWTKAGTRVAINIVPNTASAQEHYFIHSTDRTASVSFPHPQTMDVPGFVELHEGNKLAKRMRPADFGIAEDDLPALGGIVNEHRLFIRMLRGEEKAICTLGTTLQTQEIRAELKRLISLGGYQHSTLEFKS